MKTDKLTGKQGVTFFLLNTLMFLLMTLPITLWVEGDFADHLARSVLLITVLTSIGGAHLRWFIIIMIVGPITFLVFTISGSVAYEWRQLSPSDPVTGLEAFMAFSYLCLVAVSCHHVCFLIVNGSQSKG